MSYKDEFRAEAKVSAGAPLVGVGESVVYAAAALVVLVLGFVAFWPEQAAVFNQEGGLFETISAVGLLSAGLVALYRFRGLSRLYIGLVCLLLAERELEAEVYAPGSGLFELLNGLDALLDMTVVRVVLAVLVLGGLVWHGIPNGWRAFRQKAPFLVVFVLAGMAAVIAQVLEEVAGAYSSQLSATMVARLFVLEETLEMFFSIGIFASVLIGWPKARTEETTDDLPSPRYPDAR